MTIVAEMGEHGPEKEIAGAMQAPPHIADFGDGKRLIIAAAGFNIATIEADNGLKAPLMVMLHPEIPAGLSVTLTPENALDIAASLTRVAKRMRTEANDAAAAALRKAAGK